MAIADASKLKIKEKICLFLKPLLQFQRPISSKTICLHTEDIHINGNNTSVMDLKDIHINGNNTSVMDLKALCKHGLLQEAFSILHLRDHQGILANPSTYSALLQCCIDMKSLAEGRLTHAHIIQTGFKCQEVLETKLMIMYANCSKAPGDARKLFDKMHERNVVSWTAMIARYARHGRPQEALRLFCEMRNSGIQPNQFTFASVLPAFADLGLLRHGKEVHEDIVRSGLDCDVFVGTTLIDMYVKCRSIEDARKAFDGMPQRNVVSWTAMISGYLHNGYVDEALELFEKMSERNVVTWNVMIAGYVQNGYLDKARQLFMKMPRRDVTSWNTIITAYALSGQISEACMLFEKMPERNVVSWNIMIAGYAQNGLVNESLKLFQEMPERDIVSWNTIIAGYGQNGYIHEALEVFEKMPERNVISWNAILAGCIPNGHVDEAFQVFQKMPERNVVSWTVMIAGYAQNGQVDKALKLFQEMPERDALSWTAIIAGYAQNGYAEEALKLFRAMQLAGLKPNADTFASILPACADIKALEHGKEVHEDIIRSDFQAETFVGSALVNMYARCGTINDARRAFDKMASPDVVSWNAMIVGYVMHGCGMEAVQLFEQMQLSGINPDRVTFIGVLSACCHAGLVDDGWQYFESMDRYYHITPAMEHYYCMVDLLGRAGHLDNAQKLINEMPLNPDADLWVSLFGACRIGTNIELAEIVAECLFDLDPENAAPYVLLSNIYAAAGRWDDTEKLQKTLKERTLKNIPGCSWIELNKHVYTFP